MHSFVSNMCSDGFSYFFISRSVSGVTGSCILFGREGNKREALLRRTHIVMYFDTTPVPSKTKFKILFYVFLDCFDMN